MRIALVCPDAWSVLLFCKGIIALLQTLPGASIVVVSDEGEHRAELEALGVRSVHVPIARFVAPRADLAYLRALTRAFRKERCDLVLNFSTKANIYGTLAARLAGVPRVVSHVVGLGAAFLPDSSIKGKLLRATTRQLYRFACRFSDGVWFTNRNDRAYFLEHRMVQERRAVLTRNYLDTGAYAPDSVPAHEVEALRGELGLAAGDPVVVMVARMIWSKGIREFADAAEQLGATHPRAAFLLVAPLEPGHFEAVPETYIRGKEKVANLRWLGFRRDVKRIYALSDIAVLPSYYKEGGYPRALLEPMAMGKPLITSDSADCRDPVEHGRNGYVVPIRDSAALAAAIGSLLGDGTRRAAFGTYSREKAVHEFDERIIVRAALEALDVLPRGGVPAMCVAPEVLAP